MTARRFGVAGLLLCASTSLLAATSYRVTLTTKDRLKRVPVVQRVIAEGDSRRLTVEQQDDVFTYDVLLSTDSGKTVTALNTPLRTWFDGATLPASRPARTPGFAEIRIKDAKTSVTEEPTDATIAGLVTRKFVVRASYTSQEKYGDTKVNRIHEMTTLIWTTDKLDQSLAFPIRVIAMDVEPVDAELRQKQAVISGFPLRRVTSISRAYEGGAPSVEITTFEVDDIRTVPPPPASAFAKPASYVHQEPVIGSPAPEKF
jgi:hypothetical protein